MGMILAAKNAKDAKMIWRWDAAPCPECGLIAGD